MKRNNRIHYYRHERVLSKTHRPCYHIFYGNFVVKVEIFSAKFETRIFIINIIYIGRWNCLKMFLNCDIYISISAILGFYQPLGHTQYQYQKSV